MKLKDFVRSSLHSSANWAMRLIDDMRDAPLATSSQRGGNHPLWILGHLIYSESYLLDVFICGGANRFPDMASLFAAGTTPRQELEAYPSMDELKSRFEQMRAATLAYLDRISDQDFDARSHAPEELSEIFGSVGKCFSAMIVHAAFHAGQVADARRALGRSPLRM